VKQDGTIKRLPRLTADDPAGSWLTIEVDTGALTHNIKELRRLVAPPTRLMAVVKANAYGHGLLLASRAFLEGGAEVLGVHSWLEARHLREGGLDCPVLILGPVGQEEASLAAAAEVEITVASLPALAWAAGCGRIVRIHLKVETGVNRQGVTESEIPQVLDILKASPQVKLVGLSSHFADIEDTTDHGYARTQMKRFEGYRHLLQQAGISPLATHMTCSAATLLWPSVHGDLARVGISAYGIWPSRETLVSFREVREQKIDLRPALTWKCRISQVRTVPMGETVGYGRSWKAMADSIIAVLPVGYSDGWLRAFGGRAHVLIGGYRAPLVGRICMNLCMADVTCIPDVQAGDEVVLLGAQGDEVITPEMLAGHLGTIAYEVLTLPGDTWNRVSS
jgi:alanine racemase